MINVKIIGGQLVAASFMKSSLMLNERVHGVVKHHAMLLQTRVKANASGRPGPRAPTGDYRRSISRKTTKYAHMSTGHVGTNAPQGRRLEFGFTGVDSLGRYYDQPPYPHFGPALDATAQPFLDDLANAVTEGLT